MNPTAKISILGAGPGGATAALFLAQRGIEVTLIDKETFPRDKICGDALSGKVMSVLRKLDPELPLDLSEKQYALGSYGVAFYAPNGKNLRIPFKSSKQEESFAPGFISKRIDFDNYLIEKVRKNPLIEFHEGSKVTDIEKTTGGYSLNGKNFSFHTKLVIVADGAQSVFSRKILKRGVENKHHCAGLRAYYSNVTGLDYENFIELHFLKDLLPGYFWIFPLPGGMANVGLGMRTDKVSEKKVNLRSCFQEILKLPQFRDRFAGAEKKGDIQGFGLPLGSKKRSLSGDHFLLTGDAGSLIDPFTGEGISHAMISGMFAAEYAEKALTENNFSATFLREYDNRVYKRLGKELQISTMMQRLVNYPSLFNLVVNKANKNKELSLLISSMFDDLDVRKKLKDPLFYFRLFTS